MLLWDLVMSEPRVTKRQEGFRQPSEAKQFISFLEDAGILCHCVASSTILEKETMLCRCWSLFNLKIPKNHADDEKSGDLAKVFHTEGLSIKSYFEFASVVVVAVAAFAAVVVSLEVPLAIDHSVERKISIWKHQEVKNKWSATTDKTHSEATN